MHIKPVSLFFTVALGAALVSGVQAFAKNLNNNGNGNGSVQSANAKGQGQTASALGALNAGHAAPQAFANAFATSRIGLIKAYYLASQTAALTDATALQTTFEGSAPLAVRDAYIALQVDPTNAILQAAFDQAVLDAGLTPTDVAALEAAYTAWQEAVAADAASAATLEAAANKTPVSDVTKEALDNLIAGSIY